jgi:hypothetical protein
MVDRVISMVPNNNNLVSKRAMLPAELSEPYVSFISSFNVDYALNLSLCIQFI